jgi:hypothetical protein
MTLPQALLTEARFAYVLHCAVERHPVLAGELEILAWYHREVDVNDDHIGVD